MTEIRNDRPLLTQDPSPPDWVLRELVGAGVIDPRVVRLPALDRCRCAHRKGAHQGGTGPCQAHRCASSCTEFRQDPRFQLETPPGVQVRKRRLVPGDEPGTMRLEGVSDLTLQPTGPPVRQEPGRGGD